MNEFYSWHSQDARMTQLGEVATTLTTIWGPNANDILVKSGGGNELTEKSMTYDARGNGNGLVSCTITGGHQSTVSDYTALVVKEKEMKEKKAVVRRLTPLECERLQGFPDGWTDIGEWTDTKGKKHQPSDSPRYKALGNSIAVGYANNRRGFWCWMAEKMVSELKKEGNDNPTMASLFDGIGGFPLAFSSYGCEPIWASEIEEFPIAVTKIRFPEEES